MIVTDMYPTIDFQGVVIQTLEHSNKITYIFNYDEWTQKIVKSGSTAVGKLDGTLLLKLLEHVIDGY